MTSSDNHDQQSFKAASRGSAETRRQVMRKGWLWLRWSGVLVLFYPLLRFIGYKVPAIPRLVTVSKVLPQGGYYLAPDFVLFEGADGPRAISRKCTHLGCRLHYSEKEGLLVCPCHQSRFTTEGILVSGPARRSLATYAVTRLTGKDEKGYQVVL